MFGESSLGELYFINSNVHSSLEEWMIAVNEAKNNFYSYVSGIIKEDRIDDGFINLSAVYAAFSLLFVISSEKFEAALEAEITNDLRPFLKLLPDGIQPDAAKEDIYLLFINLRQNFELLQRKHDSPPVRETTVYEMKSYLSWLGVINETHTKKLFLSRRELRTPQFLGALHLSIDPLTPPELAAKAVEQHLRRYQDELQKEWEESWRDEVNAGIVDVEFASRDAQHQKLKYDFRRVFQGNKKLKNSKTLFEIWLRRLKAYQLSRNGYSPKEIAERLAPSYRYMRYDSPVVCQDLNEARALIESALQGIPLAAVESTR